MRSIKKPAALKLLEDMKAVMEKLPEKAKIGRLFIVDDGQGIVLESGIHKAAEAFGKIVEIWPGWNDEAVMLRFEVKGLVICEFTQKSRKNERAEQEHSEIEMAEIVRCRKCAKRNTPECAMWYLCEACGGQWSWETDEDFCSKGKRK